MTFLILLLWRLLSVFVVQTAHVPDEYWQSLEVAHKMTFDYGHLTWEWHAGLRSYIYPLLISWVFGALKFLHLDYAEFLITFPKILQAILSSYAEYKFYLWTNKNKIAIVSLGMNWYWYYCATRTLINTVETALTMIALSIFPWKNGQLQSTKFLWIVGLLCAMRPTAAVVWFPLCLYHFCTSEASKFVLAAKYASIGVVGLFLSTSVDAYHYGRFVITPWEFLRVNVVHKVSENYGAEPFFWYLTSGLPVLLGLQYLLLPTAFWRVFKYSKQYHKQSVLCVVICWTIAVYSLLSHKEFRFVLPLLPMFIYIVSTVDSAFTMSRKFRRIALGIFCVGNLVPALYFSMVHQRGSLDAMQFLRRELSSVEDASRAQFLFLMPCHATPLFSHLHVNVSVRFLTCEPNLSNTPEYIDETSRFFAEPEAWLDRYRATNKNPPSHLVLFDNAAEKILPFLEKYEVLTRIFYAQFPQDNYGNYILIYKLKNFVSML